MKEKGSNGDRFLKRNLSRREAIRLGGIAVLGLAFTKPAIETIYPKPAFANYKITTPPRKGCLIRVEVVAVSYSGKNVGNDWSFKFGVVAGGRGGASADTYIPDYTINLGETRQLGKVIFEKAVGQCGDYIPIELRIVARENDNYTPDDFGHEIISRRISCPTSGKRSFTVPVYERISRRTYYGRPGLLQFTVAYSAECL